jgi:tetratricopeptide (TPR) repeat protein
MSSGDSPVTFQGFDKKDWLYRELLVDDSKEKIQCLTNALLVEPDDGYVWHYLGDMYADIDEEKAHYCWNNASKSYLKRLERFKDDVKKYSKDSMHLIMMDVHSNDIHQVIASIFFSLGSIYMNLERYSLAADAYLKSFAIKDNEPLCLYFAAESLYYIEKFDESEKILKDNIKLTHHYKSYYLLGLVLWKKGKHFEAQNNFWECIYHAYDDADSCYQKHLAYHALGNPRKTEYYLKKAFEIEPTAERGFDLIRYYEENQKHGKCKKYYDLVHKMHKNY